MTKNKIPSPLEFLLQLPMYTVVPYQGEEAWEIIELLYFDGTYDCFCTKCGKESTFRVSSRAKPIEYRKDVLSQLVVGSSYTEPEIKPGIYEIAGRCSRDETHLQYHVFVADNNPVQIGTKAQWTFQKIGQYPSYGDLNMPKYRKYASVLSKIQRGELNRAIGLASHDVGIGAYVYLRRVFEALVEEAHQFALHDPEWDETAYSRSRMAEKIVLLKHHMPTFLIEHPQIYSILSKGIHELSEEECLVHFPTLRVGIELILDEKLERKEKERKISEARSALAKVMGDVKA